MTRALKWRIGIGLLLVFLAGTATGLFGGAWHARRAFTGHHGKMMGERMREHIKRRLDLTPEQVRQVEPILEETASKLHAIQAETHQRVTEAMDQSQRAMALHLTPEQQTKMRAMRDRHEERLRERHSRHGHHHHHRRRSDSPHAP